MRKKRNFSDCDQLFDGWMMYGTLGWREYIKKIGKSKWSIWYVPYDDENADMYEKSEHDISSLISYAFERDIWIEHENLDVVPGIKLTKFEKAYFEYTHSWGTLGQHMNNLLVHLCEHGTEGEFLMAKIAAGITWINPGEVVDSDLIGMKILEVSMKAIWTRTFRKAFSVSTYYGKGQIYPPNENGVATLFLNESQSSYSFDFKPKRVQLSKKCMEELHHVQIENIVRSVIFHIPHASTYIPDGIEDQFLLDWESLRLEQLKMTDHYADELFVYSKAPRIVAPVSRLVCDVERFADNDKEPMALVGMGMIYEKTHDGKQLRRELHEYEKAELLHKYHKQNAQNVESEVREALRGNGVALIIDCHSFPSVPHPFESDQAIPRPDICIGTDSYHTPEDLLELVQSYFLEKGYSVAINSPYSGTYVPLYFYQRNKKCLSIMIEVNRSLYMDEATGEKLPNFEHIQRQLMVLLELIKESLLKICFTTAT